MNPTISLIPYLCVADAPAALAFYADAFGAEILERMDDDAGKVAHATLAMDSVRFFVSSAYPEHDAVPPDSERSSPVLLVLEVSEIEARLERAIAAGALLDRPLNSPDNALRTAKLRDPFGHRWMLVERG